MAIYLWHGLAISMIHDIDRQTKMTSLSGLLVLYLGDHHSISGGGGGGGAEVFVADKLFISTRLGGALNNSNYITCFLQSQRQYLLTFQVIR